MKEKILLKFSVKDSIIELDKLIEDYIKAKLKLENFKPLIIINENEVISKD